MPRVQGEPATIKEHFIPSAEIHRGRINRYADVTKITRAIPRRDVHASGKGHCKMSEVPANAAALLVSLRSGAIASCVMIAEFDAIVSVVANGLRALPTALDTSKERPCQVGELFGVAIATSEKEGENLSGQRTYVPLLRGRADLVGSPLSSTTKSLRTSSRPGGATSRVQIAVRIEKIPRVHAWRKTHRLIAKDVPIAGGMGGEHKHHKDCVGTLKGDVVACPDFHKDVHKVCGL